MQATARRLSVVSATSCARRRLIRDVHPIQNAWPRLPRSDFPDRNSEGPARHRGGDGVCRQCCFCRCAWLRLSSRPGSGRDRAPCPRGRRRICSDGTGLVGGLGGGWPRLVGGDPTSGCLRDTPRLDFLHPAPPHPCRIDALCLLGPAPVRPSRVGHARLWVLVSFPSPRGAKSPGGLAFAFLGG
jgi:hypothetical protein